MLAGSIKRRNLCAKFSFPGYGSGGGRMCVFEYIDSIVLGCLMYKRCNRTAVAAGLLFSRHNKTEENKIRLMYCLQ